MRKSVLAAVLAAGALGLAACSSGTDGNKGDQSKDQSGSQSAVSTEGKLVVWVDETREAPVKAAAETFTSETGVEVELVQKNFEDIRKDFTSQVPTGSGPDITVGANDWIGELVNNGVVAPIELGDKAADFQTSAIDAFTWDGNLYALPYAVENVALLRNVDLAPEAPATWDDAMAAADAAGVEYKFLVQMNGENGDPYTFYPLQTSFGSEVFVQNADGSYTTELGLANGGDEFAAFLAENGHNGTDIFNQDRNYDIVLDAFASGKSPFLIGGPWMLDTIQEKGDFELAVDAVPSAGGKEARPFVGVQGFYLSAQSKNALDAQNFLTNYLSTEDAQLALYEVGGRPPALTAASDVAAEDPITAGFIAAGANGLPNPGIPEMGAVWDPWGKTEASIINGTAADPSAAWAEMIAAIEAAIAG